MGTTPKAMDCYRGMKTPPLFPGGSVDHQETIYKNKRKFLYYFVGDHRPGALIPDTHAAREDALKNGATSFSTLSFCRHHVPGLPAPRKWGNLHLQCIMPGKQSPEAFDALKRSLNTFLSNIGLASGVDILVVPQGECFFQLIVPDLLLGFENGHPLLAEIYEFAAKCGSDCLKRDGLDNYSLSSSTTCSSLHNTLQISFSQFINISINDYINIKDIKYTKTSDNTFITVSPQLKYELIKGGIKIWSTNIYKMLSSRCWFLKRFTSKLLPPEDIKLLLGISGLPQPVKQCFLDAAVNNMRGRMVDQVPVVETTTQCSYLKKSNRCRKTQCTLASPGELLAHWPQVTPFSPNGNDVDIKALKCAIAIFQKLAKRKVSEFQARDAHRMVRGTYGTICEVEKGLDLLEARGFVVRADMPHYSHVGRRPSPWFLVNPKVQGQLFFG